MLGVSIMMLRKQDGKKLWMPFMLKGAKSMLNCFMEEELASHLKLAAFSL